MDHARELETARRYVLEGEMQVAGQRELLEDMIRAGLDTTHAARLLNHLESRLELNIKHLNALLAHQR